MLRKKKTEIVESKNTRKTNNRAYMSSYDWNYMVLEIVDYLENKLSTTKEDNSDKWINFKKYCSENNLNWRVIKKMIEFSVVEVFDSETDLANFGEFKALEKEMPTEPAKDATSEPQRYCSLSEESLRALENIN
jgi:hypothetical protein